ncbi:hypothetical protein SAMD00019534_013340 [Acytostelium subglobosum LB1]|uniref:hypothetical protein n=1 Tax=Acytostelium subglobosum LB1 TaxID=1410327 RepID=UPI000644D8D6|nr:hypothetical protein SAMD00019534_013340 [Acytostelium subglobosum LB1]GAM18159.1 hypothetical protein SAMD00019534_013340 [Acytostelium subglobosum LB1]|eukprot:XP_012758755.1 hypothetical protein SAMD00019534_013340 [Acytostelium subglobosum LB1]
MVCEMKTNGIWEGVNITGDPGIGKSMWVSYLMSSIVSLGDCSFWYHSVHFGFSAYFIFKNYVLSVTFTTNPRDVLYVTDPETWYIVDGVEPVPTTLFTILLSSPSNEVIHREFRKAGDSNDIKYMPDWTLQEINEANNLLQHPLTPDQITNGFHKWGGIPRYVLQLIAGTTGPSSTSIGNRVHASCAPIISLRRH